MTSVSCHSAINTSISNTIKCNITLQGYGTSGCLRSPRSVPKPSKESYLTKCQGKKKQIGKVFNLDLMIKTQALIGRNELCLIFLFPLFIYSFTAVCEEKSLLKDLCLRKMKIHHVIVQAVHRKPFIEGCGCPLVPLQIPLLCPSRLKVKDVSYREKGGWGTPIDPITPCLCSFLLGCNCTVILPPMTLGDLNERLRVSRLRAEAMAHAPLILLAC